MIQSNKVSTHGRNEEKELEQIKTVGITVEGGNSYQHASYPLLAIVGSRGTVTIPAILREELGIQPGNAIILHREDNQLILTPANVTPRLSKTGEEKLRDSINEEHESQTLKLIMRRGPNESTIV